MTTSRTSLKEKQRLPNSPILTYLLTYLLTPWSRVLLEKLTSKFSNRICITVHTKSKFAHELSKWDKVSRLQFRSKVLDIKNNSDIANTLLMYVKAHFLVSGYVNKQNCRYWAPNNPHELHQRPLHSAKMTLWCAVSSHGIIDLYFLENAD